MKKDSSIVEKKLGISPDYQFKALNSKNFLQSNWHWNKLKVVESLINQTKPKRVLDLGTGSGNFEIYFAERIGEIVGIDYNPEALGFLKKTLQLSKKINVHLINHDITKLSSIKNLGKFDLIIMIDVIEHLPSNSINKLISEMRDLLNPGGKVCIITPNYQSLWIFIEKITDNLKILPHMSGDQHLTKFYPANLLKLFKDNNFKTLKLTTFNSLFFVPVRNFSANLAKLEIRSNFKFGNLIFGVFEKND